MFTPASAVVLGVGAESEGEMAHRGGEAVAERLGTKPVTFPSGHGGFLGGEYGQAGDPNAADPIDCQSSRPDVSVLVYPVITFTDPSTHKGSRTNLLGNDPPQELIDAMSAEKRVTKDTPPTFIFHTSDDEAVPVENALMYAAALRKNKVPFELHVYEHGRHGVGLATNDPILGTWPGRCADWLKGKGFGESSGKPAH